MNQLYELLEHDHREVKRMFKEAVEKEDTSKYNQIKKELEIHFEGEEKYFYPEAKKVDEELVQHGIKEHEEAKGMIKDLDKLDKGDTQFMTKLKELKDAVEHHIKDEEEKLFPETQKEISDNKSTEIAKKIEEEKSKSM